VIVQEVVTMPRKPSYDREDLIRRAKDVFWKHGWAGTSMKDLERELNLKPGSFYAAFGSKDALYRLALERYAQDSSEVFLALAKEVGPLEALKAMPKHIVCTEGAASKACMISKTFLELSRQDHDLADIAAGMLRKKEDLFADLFAQAQSAGDIDATRDPKRLARRYQSDLLGLRVTAERSPEDAQDIAEDIAADLDRL
jgi:AcrR family transcriptional regulator